MSGNSAGAAADSRTAGSGTAGSGASAEFRLTPTNAMMLKGALPEVAISVRANACAGVTPESHETALAAMKMCQIEIL